MNAFRLGLLSFAACGSAVMGCNGLLGIDDGAYGSAEDGGIVVGSEGGTGDGGPGPNDGGSNPDASTPGDGGSTVVLADKQASAISLIQDVDNLYWLSDGDIMAVAKAGGGTPRKVGKLANATLIACDPEAGGNVYAAVDNIVNLYPKAGGGLGQNVMTLAVGRTANALGVDATNLFASDYDENNDSAVVRRAPKAGGGASTVIAPSNTKVVALGVDAVSAVWLNEPSQTTRTISELKATGGSVATHPTANGGAVSLDIRNLTLDATNLYWLDYIGSTGRLRSHIRDNSSPTPADLASFNANEGPVVVAVQGGVPYVLVTQSLGTKGVVAKVSGSAHPTVVPDLESPSSMVVDANGIYVAEDRAFGSAKVTKFPLPK